MKIAILVFDELTALDAVGPYEVLHSLPEAKVHWVGKRKGAHRCDGGLSLVADYTLDEVREADLLLVPGGFGARKLQHDRELVDWLRAIDQTTQTTATVCTGSILFAATGLLQGRRATTHWAFFDQLANHGVTPVTERVVRDGKYASAAGVSAGIDLALTLAVELAGLDRASGIQLGIEYDPQPPLQAGNASRVPVPLRNRLYAASHARDAEIAQNASRNCR
ncbi:MAG TPA: DJ-1/PfpI family protein [Polyangiales bacterium]|nr:DJ-1/PfpI family protein [Polyangiales bacterium]